MPKYHVFAHDTFWGTWEADSEADAMQTAADDVGTEGNTKGLRAYEVGTNADADAEAAEHY
ncbi:MAG: hypothetical protein MJH10_10110 [Epibacterium sp.]|nr:hypothetical protein [Epibacterium sp.]NQX73891.1 hypothetical protein [Epibacterium sp.]